MKAENEDLITRIVLVLSIAALLAGALLVVWPFLPALLWAVVIVIATWPVLQRLQRVCRGHRRLAIALLSVGLLVIIILPVTWLLSTLITHVPQLKDMVAGWMAGPLPAPPAWLTRLPFGDRLSVEWQQLVAQTPESLVAQLRPYIMKTVQWLGAHVGSLGGLALEFLLTLMLVFVLYVHGDTLAGWVRRVARRIGGARAEESLVLSSETMGAIAAGVVLTALAQAIIAGLGLWAAGVPGAGLLTSLVFVTCIVQLGTLPVLIPAVLWLFFNGAVGWAVALAVWTAALTIGDGFLRAWLIQRGAKLPFWLIFAGVIGGLLAFGVVGIFVGPILLAAALRLLDLWVDTDEQSDTAV